MNGLSTLTAMEIFQNPRDLDISIYKSGGSYGFSISRGPGGNFQLLRKSLPFAPSLDEAVGVVEQILDYITKYESSFIPDYSHFLDSILEVETSPKEYGPVLTSALVEKIVEDLYREKSSRTYGVHVHRSVRTLDIPPPSTQGRRGGKRASGGKRHFGKHPLRQ